MNWELEEYRLGKLRLLDREPSPQTGIKSPTYFPPQPKKKIKKHAEKIRK